jgi:hypothetical protein
MGARGLTVVAVPFRPWHGEMVRVQGRDDTGHGVSHGPGVALIGCIGHVMRGDEQVQGEEILCVAYCRLGL